jgi:cytochrome c553
LNLAPGRSGLLLAALLAGCGAGNHPGTDPPSAGERIYRQGLLPSGEPLTAIVAGDVPVVGTRFACQSCHGRSGMGVYESSYVVPPISAQFLFVPSPQPARPAYNVQSLARVLRDGTTPGGRTLDRLMPRYRLGDDDVAALAGYLKELSASNSPGVDRDSLHMATVIAGEVDPAEREAVLAVLRRYFEEKNRQTRAEGERWDRGYTPESKLPTVFRQWVLEEWTLSGPAEGWESQLDAYYRQTPVFAMVGGLGAGGWGPVGRFCERRELPCLLPTTDWPDAQDGEFYTLFYSRGLALEADLIAAHLGDHPVERVVQVACDQAGKHASDALAAALATRDITERRVQLDCTSESSAGALAHALRAGPNAALVLWLRSSQFGALGDGLPAARFYVSSTLLARDPPPDLSAGAGTVFMAHPFRLPGSPDPALLRFKVWAKTRDIALVAPRSQAEAFFACLAANDAILHMGRFFVRDYMLDMLDHTQALAAYLPFHPRPTLGPGQRYLDKGGYMLPIVAGMPDTAAAVWIAP